MRKLTDAIDKYCKDNEVGPSTKIITGDFNSEVRSSVCDHLRAAGYQSTFEKCPPRQDADTDTNIDAESKRDRQREKDSDICNSAVGSNRNSDSFSESLGSSLLVGGDCPIRSTVKRSADEDREKEKEMEEKEQAKSFHKFVSHRTHTNEDLGVDHIFVKPEGLLSPLEKVIELSRLNSASSPMTAPAAFPSTQETKGMSPSYDESKLNEEVYAELESDMDGIDTMRKFTEEVIADSKAYRSEEEEKKKNNILLLERSEEHEEEKAREKEHYNIYSPSPVKSKGLGPSKDIAMSSAALTSQRQLSSSTCLFFANSRVIPSNIPLDVWSTAFLLSDHRPVSSSIILARPCDIKN